MADIVTRTELEEAKVDCKDLRDTLNTKQIINPRWGEAFYSLPLAIQKIMETGGFEPFLTQAQLLASTPTISPKAAKALDTKKIWYWGKDEGETVDSWHDTGLSELDQAITYTDGQFNLAIKRAVFETLSQLFGLAKSDDPTKIGVLLDGVGRILLGYDLEKDTGIYAGMLEQVVEIVPGLKIYNDGRYLGLLGDSERRILIGYDMLNDLPIIAGLDELINGAGGTNTKPVPAERNHIVGYGQSLKTGATATVILSILQPYFNVTFGTGPRMDSAATSVIPLVEQFNNPSSDGYSNRGETCCSGAANYASRAMMLENGIDPKDHVIFASTAAHGGYRIDQLKKGSEWYSFLIKHITEAKRLSGDKTYKTQVIDWGQGENDAIYTVRTPYAVYKSELAQLQLDVSSDIKEITGQSETAPFITYQMSYAARTWPDIAKAQLDLVRESPYFMLSTPMYHMPYAEDSIHLTNVGYKWLGAYVGRAYKQYMIDGRKSDFINPKVAQLVGDEIHIHFDVPKAPLVLDTATLAATTDNGFKVLVNDTAATISGISAENDKVIIKLSSPPATGASVIVRYALDYLGAGLSIDGGASGNLRDSTTDSIEIAGVERPLYHVCPHFELTAFTDKGI
ncbi:sialate O-acetylesterase [Acinetobacter baumannii]